MYRWWIDQPVENMNKIIFSGISETLGCLVYGSFNSNEECPAIYSEEHKRWWDIYPESLSQFVGLSDENNEMLFEGDLVRVFHKIGNLQDNFYVDAVYKIRYKMPFDALSLEYLKPLDESELNQYPVFSLRYGTTLSHDEGMHLCVCDYRYNGEKINHFSTHITLWKE